MKKLRSFTLLETMLALTIIIMILGAVYAFYGYSVRLTAAGREKLQDTQLARVILFKIASELKAVTSAGSRFSAVMVGEPDKITFLTTTLPSKLVFFPTDIFDKGRPVEHDLRSVQYYLGRDENDPNIILGFERDELRCLLTPMIEEKSVEELTQEDIQNAQEEADKFKTHFDLGDNKAMSQQPILQQLILTDRIKYIRFDYHDGKQWLTRWHPIERDALPRAVKVTIGFSPVTEEEFQQESLLSMDDRPWHDDRYTLMVSLILADDLKARYAEQKEEE